MTLDANLQAKLADYKPGEGRQTLTAAGDGWTATVAADHADQVGCLVWELAVQRAGDAAGAGDAAAARAWGDRVARRATGLLEPLRLLEIDAGRAEAVLRSDKPSRKGDDLFYYELHLHGTHSATARRYRQGAAPGSHREQVPYALTHEALGKLAGDLTADA